MSGHDMNARQQQQQQQQVIQASEGPIDVAAGLRQWSVHLSVLSFDVLVLVPSILQTAVQNYTARRMFVSWGALSNFKKQPNGSLWIHRINRRWMMSPIRERTLPPCANREQTPSKIHGHVFGAGVYYHRDKCTNHPGHQIQTSTDISWASYGYSARGLQTTTIYDNFSSWAREHRSQLELQPFGQQLAHVRGTSNIVLRNQAVLAGSHTLRPFTVVSGKSSVGGEVWLAICKGFNTDQSRRYNQLRATVFCFRC
jgi:hypothetical protein